MEVLPYTGIPHLRKLKVQGNASSDVEFFISESVNQIILRRIP